MQLVIFLAIVFLFVFWFFGVFLFFFFLLEQIRDGVTQYVTHTAYLPGTQKAPISQHTE